MRNTDSTRSAMRWSLCSAAVIAAACTTTTRYYVPTQGEARLTPSKVTTARPPPQPHTTVLCRSAAAHPVELRAVQPHHVRRTRQADAGRGAHGIDLSLDGVARDGTARPALGHHGAQPDIVGREQGLRARR